MVEIAGARQAVIVLVFAATITGILGCRDTTAPLTQTPQTPGLSFGMGVVDADGVIDLGTLGGPTSSAAGVNADTQVVGTSRTESQFHAFRWTPSTGMQDLTPDAPQTSRGRAINAHGTVVGEVHIGTDVRAYRVDPGGELQLLDHLPGGHGATPFGINDLGEVVGVATSASFVTTAALWDATGAVESLGTLGGTWSDAYDINNDGVVVGIAEDGAGNLRAFRWSRGSGMEALPTAFGGVSWANAINDHGVIVGTMAGPGGGMHAALWPPTGGVVDLGTLGGNNAVATDINDDGIVVGNSRVHSGASHGFVWTPADSTMSDMGPDASFSAISSNGIIAGTRSGRASLWLLQLSAPEIQLTCEPLPVIRGEDVLCSVRAPNGTNVEVQEWVFRSDPFVNPIDQRTLIPSAEWREAGPSLEWRGAIAVAGSVVASLAGASGPDSIVDRIEVAARPWAEPPIPTPLKSQDGCARPLIDMNPFIPQIEIVCAISYPPWYIRDLGSTRLFPYIRDRTPRDSVATITSGPNTGWSFVDAAAPPVRFDFIVAVLNRVLFDETDTFWNFRPDCDVERIRNVVDEHEMTHVAVTAGFIGEQKFNTNFLESFALPVEAAEFREHVGTLYFIRFTTMLTIANMHVDDFTVEEMNARFSCDIRLPLRDGML